MRRTKSNLAAWLTFAHSSKHRNTRLLYIASESLLWRRKQRHGHAKRDTGIGMEWHQRVQARESAEGAGGYACQAGFDRREAFFPP